MVEAMYTAINMDIQETQEKHVKHNTFPEWHGIIIWASHGLYAAKPDIVTACQGAPMPVTDTHVGA
uniref:Uncharacterized protein n=1 Tax=Oryza meridionalis TaxID=40149 RepID=A0A0E0F3S0_9ORYZ